MSDREKSSVKSLLQRPFASTFLWIILSLVIADAALTNLNPLQHIKNFAYMPLNQNPLVSKVPEYLTSKSNPELLVMGSSLPMMAIAHGDSQFKRKESKLDSRNLDSVRPYSKALYLTDQINQKLKDKKIDSFNLTLAGCMASDIELLIEKALKFGKTPEVIVYGIGPRSFLDNSVDKEGKTPTWQVLSQWKSLEDVLNTNNTFQENRDIILSSFWNFYRTKSDYKTFLTGYACYKLDRSPTIYAAQQKEMAKKLIAKAESEVKEGVTPSQDELDKRMVGKTVDTNGHEDPVVLKKDLALYDYRYNPPDFKQYDIQKTKLERVLSLCNRKGIRLMVVAMPITEQNKSLLDQKLYQDYLDQIPVLTAKYGGEFINLDDGSTYNITDFEDSVHTNEKGGAKVNRKLADKITSQNWL